MPLYPAHPGAAAPSNVSPLAAESEPGFQPVTPEPAREPTSADLPEGRAVQRAAWIFYFIAALGSVIGQIWVGLDVPPWPQQIDWWWRIPLVAPFAVVIDLGGVVASAFADYRRRLGEHAYGWRTLSAAAVSVAVAINIIGHHDVPYLSVVFGGLGIFAYTVWLGHTAARRRDALRATAKLADTAPVYGLRQALREPAVTGRARQLAVDHGYTRQESLVIARRQLHDERRRTALTRHVAKLIREQHDDPTLAKIAVATLDIDAVAAALTARSDTEGWARLIGTDLTPPAPDTVEQASDDSEPPRGPIPPADVLRRVPQDPAGYARWRQLWTEFRDGPIIGSAEFAERHDISIRQVQWIRRVGQSGLLDSPIPLLDRVAQLAAPTSAHSVPLRATDDPTSPT